MLPRSAREYVIDAAIFSRNPVTAIEAVSKRLNHKMVINRFLDLSGGWLPVNRHRIQQCAYISRGEMVLLLLDYGNEQQFYFTRADKMEPLFLGCNDHTLVTRTFDLIKDKNASKVWILSCWTNWTIKPHCHQLYRLSHSYLEHIPTRRYFCDQDTNEIYEYRIGPGLYEVMSGHYDRSSLMSHIFIPDDGKSYHQIGPEQLGELMFGHASERNNKCLYLGGGE